MPYKEDPRRTVTVNLLPDEYDALAADAYKAGYATPGTYAKALVRARGNAPAPIRDERMQERVAKWRGKNSELAQQLHRSQAREQALQTQLQAAQHELTQRPTYAEQHRLVNEAVARVMAERAAPAEPPAAVSSAAAREARRQARLAKASNA
jgi:hypothetical protein